MTKRTERPHVAVVLPCMGRLPVWIRGAIASVIDATMLEVRELASPALRLAAHLPTARLASRKASRVSRSGRREKEPADRGPT